MVLKELLDGFIEAHCKIDALTEDDRFSIGYQFMAGALALYKYLEESLEAMPIKVFLIDYTRLGDELNDYVDRLQKSGYDGKELNGVGFKRPGGN
jgi:hypothetical protein